MVFQGFGQLVVFGLPDLAASAVCREVMRFVENHQIPTRRIQQALDARRALQGVDAGDQSVVLGESVGLAVSDVALGAEHLEVEVEHFVQLAMPVVHQTRWHHHQRAGQFAPAGQLPKNECRLYGLTQSDLVGDEVAPGRCGGNAVCQNDLMGEQVDLG